MADRRCSEDECAKPVHGRGWCKTHYARWMRSRPDYRRRILRSRSDVADVSDETLRRFWNQVEVGHPLGCWLWTGTVDRDGYGEFYAEGRSMSSHRLSFARMCGPIPDGYHVDHLCRVRNCVNPDHLEAVTPEENVQRMPVLFGRQPVKWVDGEMTPRPRDECHIGHAMTPENTYTRPTGRVECRACRNERRRARRDAGSDRVR